MKLFFHNIVNNKPELLEDITILDDHKKQYTITEFMDILSKLKSILINLTIRESDECQRVGKV